MNIDKNTLAEKTLTLLEYSQIMESVASFSLSAEAADLIKDSKPLKRSYAEEKKAKVREIFELKKTGEEEPGTWLPSIGFLIPKIETEGTVLDTDEALAVGLFIERGMEVVKWIKKINESQTTQRIISKEIDFTSVSSIPLEVFKIIDRDGNLRDLPVLRAIKRRIESLEKELNAAVSRYSSDDEYRQMLQSNIPSQRDGRAVIAVKVNFRGRIKGIVHEASSSGQTLFIEPLDVVEKNNDILLEKRNLDAEIQKLMRELTQNICVHSAELKVFHSVIIELEDLRARASYSTATKGYFAGSPVKNYETLYLIKARHPLLKKPVPINIEMPDDIRTLIITGPNTGGKTVALKTLGLLALMNQSALALPLEEGSVLPVFDGVYADIGDEQSINQSLSTFSAHITNISAIAKHATERSLVLLDELGSGTDPEEGGAIAMAILDYLIDKKSRMIITTHHGILKHYGYTREGVENASVEFDTHTLSPTYKIINGLPGESRALDIAEANGLDKGIVDKARRYINEDKSDVSQMIKGLEQKQRELAGVERKSAIEQDKLKEEKRRMDLKELQLRQKEAQLKQEHIGKLQQLLGESRKTLENLVREIKEGEITREKTLKVKDFLNELAHNVDNESDALDKEELELKEQFRRLESHSSAGNADRCAAEKTDSDIFTQGMEVFAGSSKQRGVIIRPDKKGKGKNKNSWLVKVGALKISFPERELTPVQPKGNAGRSALPPVSWTAEVSASGDAVYELMIRRMKLEDAMEALRRQMEAAILTGLKYFSVIHGKGSGILQKAVHDYLKKDPNVADYYFSRPEMGGFGRTEVILK